MAGKPTTARPDFPPPAGASGAVRHQRASGIGRLATQVAGTRTRIRELFQEGCAKIRLPATHSDRLEAILINTAGGLTGGDSLTWQIYAAPGSHLSLTTQACERVYKSTGADARVETRLDIAENAHVDWLPQETILFEQSRLHRRLEADLAPGASLTAIEAVLLGREAMGEAARSALLDDQWRIRRAGRLVHAEANRLSASDLERAALSLLAGNNAFATIVHVAEDAERRLEAVRAALPPHARAAASAIGERLVIRILAPSGLALRRLVTPILERLSHSGRLPQIWTT